MTFWVAFTPSRVLTIEVRRRGRPKLVPPYRKPRPIGSGGAWQRDLLAVLPRPRPQQSVAFATFVVEQVSVDRRVEGGIVEVERKVVATFLRTLRPGGA